MILDQKTHPGLFYTTPYKNHQYIEGSADVSVLKDDELDACYVSAPEHLMYKRKLTYVLPYLFFKSLVKPEIQEYTIGLLAKLHEKKNTQLIESLFAYGLIQNVDVQFMKEFLPYVDLNKHFSFDVLAPSHYYAGLTPLMLAREHGTVDLFLAQPHLDLTIQANPSRYVREFENHLRSEYGYYEKFKDKKEFLASENKTALEYSIYYKEKYKKNKLLALMPAEERMKQEKEKFDAIVLEPRVHVKTSKFIKEVFVNNQYLIDNLSDTRLRDALVYKNERQSNALFHAIKEGKKDVVYKLLELNYFHKNDKSNTDESYFTYAYRHGQKTLAFNLFDNGYYVETLETFRKKATWNRDATLYEKVITQMNFKDELYCPIRTGSIAGLDYLIKHFNYTQDEKENTLKHYAYALLDKTHPEIEKSNYRIDFDVSHGIQKAYFHLLKHCMNSTENKDRYFNIFFNSYSEAYQIDSKNISPEFQKNLEKQVAMTFAHLIRINPSLKKQALELFLGLDPNNSHLINMEKKGMEAFFKKMDKEEQKQDENVQKIEKKKFKI